LTFSSDKNAINWELNSKVCSSLAFLSQVFTSFWNYSPNVCSLVSGFVLVYTSLIRASTSEIFFPKAENNFFLESSSKDLSYSKVKGIAFIPIYLAKSKFVPCIYSIFSNQDLAYSSSRLANIPCCKLYNKGFILSSLKAKYYSILGTVVS